MRDTLSKGLRALQQIKIRKSRTSIVLMLLSLVVVLDVFWILRQPGWTLAGDATCGILEHTHNDECSTQICICDLSEENHTHEDACYTQEMLCHQEEHSHSITCYSDETADVETQLDWQEMFASYPYTGDLRQDLVGIAQTQAGYSESELNFEVGSDGIRRGYTRYGAWYGAPYSDWSAMFVSFCLHYAGANPDEVPGNTGATAMAAAWDALGKYAPTDSYIPSPGDLVFFIDNTVGIVTEVNNATIYVIGGNIENTVRGTTLSLADETIAGWGSTTGTVPITEDTLEDADWLDISNGPIVTITVDDKEISPPQRFNLKSTRTAVDLTSYLLDPNVGGNFFYTLLDTNNKELPKDDSKNYIVTAGTTYKLTFTITSPSGIHPGTYQHQIPGGLQVNGGTGSIILKNGTHVGEWAVTDTGLITLVFNSNMNHQTGIAISTSMGVQFPAQDSPIEFDGDIIVTVNPPPAEENPTQLNKWGEQGNSDSGQDPSKIYWTSQILGHADSNIPGSILTDQIASGDHSYTASDIAGGLEITVGEPNPAGGDKIWHTWFVSPDDPNLTWDEKGFTYKIPEIAFCNRDYCGELPLGNDGWEYYVRYTSTPSQIAVGGKQNYSNLITLDGHQHYGWGSFDHGDTHASVFKSGSFHSDADGGAFLWEVQAVIPGLKPGERAPYSTQIIDHLRVKTAENGTIAHVQNDADHAKVTAVYNGQTITVPHVENATSTDQFAWDVAWSSAENGIYSTRTLRPLCRCNCTAETCHYWDPANNRCGAFHYLFDQWGHAYSSGFCYCWTPEQDMIFTFSYETKAPEVIKAHGGQGYNLQNEGILQQLLYQPNGIDESFVTLGVSVANIPIPGVFRKKLTDDFDGYTAHYKITVNEGKLSLTNGTPLTIEDTMSQTLAYISGSLVITAEDANGDITTLTQGTDFTVSYDGSGTETVNNTPVHILEIVILRPQPVKYTLDYDTTLIMPDQIVSGIEYSNSASISLWGKDFFVPGEEKVYADFIIASNDYSVEVFKTCAETGDPLGGATFGLYNANGGLITSGVTDANGKLLFRSKIDEGIVLREHVLYYLQEMKAPPQYQLDDTKYWFCFCDNATSACETCSQVIGDTNAFRIPFDRIGKVDAVNQFMNYDLPATGGSGIYPLMLVSVVFIITPLVYGFIQRRKRERRSTG